MSRFCPRCGAELSPEDRFCSACGAAVPGAVFSNKAVGQEPLTGTAFVEKSKEWARPQKGGMHPGFIVLLVLLLLVFLGVAALLGIHLFGADSARPSSENQVAEEKGVEALTPSSASYSQERTLTQQEAEMLQDFISQFEQRVEQILVQNWDGMSIKGAYTLEGYVLEGSTLWKGMDARTGAWNGAQKEGLPELESYQIESYFVQWDGEVLLLHAQERLTGKDPSGKEIALQFEDTYMLERYFGNYRCFDAQCSELLEILDLYYWEATSANLEFWVISGASRYYTDEELARADAFELSVLRNGMYALCGKIFTQNEPVRSFFEQFYWYVPDTEDDEIVRSRMNEYQLYNITRILEMEREKGYSE